MRSLVAACLFAAGVVGMSSGVPGQQPPEKKQKKAQPKVDPAANKPDDTTRQQIEEKTRQLRDAIKPRPQTDFTDAMACLRAAENIVRHGEWLTADSPKQTLRVLDLGLERAALADEQKHPWLDVRGKWIARAYRSRIDDSIQPYTVVLPPGYGEPGRKFRVDVVLHGRDGTLTEVKFISGNDGKAGPKDLDHIQLQVYGRGNNAYRWAGETDVFEALGHFRDSEWRRLKFDPIDMNRVVLRGFSMGGAGTWHIGLHHPDRFCVIGPGAGFTTTHGYVGNLPKQLPDYQEKCLRIYDAVDYAENAFNVPVVAYSGEIDPQKKAADNIENALKGFKEPLRFTHLVAPGLEHKMPPEWQAKADAEYRKYAGPGRNPKPDRVRFVTYTPAYGKCDWVTVVAMERTYDRAIVDASRQGNRLTVTTTNVRQITLSGLTPDGGERSITIDGQTPDVTAQARITQVRLFKSGDKWVGLAPKQDPWAGKRAGLQGPIDDAFRAPFKVVGPSKPGSFASARLNEFAALWDKHFRGTLPVIDERDYPRLAGPNLVLFGDPWTNPLIAEVLPGLPIKWTQEKLVANGVEYDAKTHVPVLTYPKPLGPRPGVATYVVINSGHTFRDADLRGTNALLYPRLGDWAVIKPTPTDRDPAAFEVVAAGLFDENWQFAGLVAPGAKLEKLWSAGEFTEGPAEAPDGSIYFSDIGNRIMRFNPKTMETSTFRDPGGRSNGLKFDAQGRLIACEGANTGGNRRVSVTEKDGTVRTLADKFDGKRFNSPNDLCLDAKGRVYFSDPRYVGDEKRELDTESVYRIDPDGKVTRVVSDVKKPNGLVLSPDGKTLYVSDHDPSGPRQLVAFPLNVDGTVGAKKVLHDFGKGRGIDGMTVTPDGVIVATAGSGAAGGIYFFSPEGKQLGFLATTEDPNNCCFGGADRKTLYITAGKSLYRIGLTVAGAPTAPTK